MGSVLVSSSVAVWAAFWIYALQTDAQVLSMPTWICLAIGLVGISVTIGGLKREGAADSSPQHFVQYGGTGSTNVQAGRDATIEGDR